jgi:hypothetical protein
MAQNPSIRPSRRTTGNGRGYQYCLFDMLDHGLNNTGESHGNAADACGRDE